MALTYTNSNSIHPLRPNSSSARLDVHYSTSVRVLLLFLPFLISLLNATIKGQDLHLIYLYICSLTTTIRGLSQSYLPEPYTVQGTYVCLSPLAASMSVWNRRAGKAAMKQSLCLTAVLNTHANMRKSSNRFRPLLSTRVSSSTWTAKSPLWYYIRYILVMPCALNEKAALQANIVS